MIVTQVQFDTANFYPLPEKEVVEIKEREKAGVSVCLKFECEKTFYVVIDADLDSVHVRRIGGPFAFCWDKINDICEKLARNMGVKKITCVADAAFMRYAAKKCGMIRVHGDLYERLLT